MLRLNGRHLALALTLFVMCGQVWACLPRPQPKYKPIDIVSFTAKPNPAAVGETVTVYPVIKTAEEKNELFASLYFGDGTAYQSFSGSSNWDDLKAVQHTYTAAGVYAVTLWAETPMLSAQSTLFIVVGRGSVVNPVSSSTSPGVFMTATDANGATRDAPVASRYVGGVCNVQTGDTSNRSVNASTEYEDLPGRSSTVAGLKTSHTYAQKGIYRATATTVDSYGSTVGKARKMINVSSRDVGDSAAPADPASSDIKITKIAGKLSFAKNTPDKLSFAGEIELPAGFVPGASNEISVGVGNIVDTVTVDAKGKMTAPGTAGIITKLGVKFPKAGLTIAKVSVAMALAGMSAGGMDTEGITSSVRSDESKLKSVSRQIQVDMLLAGAAYETSTAVLYKVSKPKTGATTSESGQFKGLPSRSGK